MSNATSTLSRREARYALTQARLTDIFGVLAYAEAFGMLAAGVQVSMGGPARLIVRAVDETVRGEKQWRSTVDSFPDHLCKLVRLEIASTLTLHARTRCATPDLWSVNLAPTQVGDLRGVEQLGHMSGLLMQNIRANDRVMLAAAVVLTEQVRARLLRLAGDPDEEDTERLGPVATISAPRDADDRGRPT